MNGSFIHFTILARKPKTWVWIVVNKESGDSLGLVQWHGPWRCYAFFPAKDTVFERQCLRDIAKFCEEQTQLQRKGAAA